MAEIEPIDLKRGKSVNISLAFAPHSAKPVANGAASAGDDTITIDALDSYMSAELLLCSQVGLLLFYL